MQTQGLSVCLLQQGSQVSCMVAQESKSEHSKKPGKNLQDFLWPGFRISEILSSIFWWSNKSYDLPKFKGEEEWTVHLTGKIACPYKELKELMVDALEIATTFRKTNQDVERKVAFQYLVSNNSSKHFLMGKCSMWRESMNRFFRLSLPGGTQFLNIHCYIRTHFNGVFF